MSRPILTMPSYDEVLKARIYPWAHRLHTWIGFVYVYDDTAKQPILVYFVPAEGKVGYYVHLATVTIQAGRAARLASEPNPATDELKEVIDLT